jgi:hypothetical protein
MHKSHLWIWTLDGFRHVGARATLAAVGSFVGAFGLFACQASVAAAPQSSGTIVHGNIRITFDERGVGGIAHPNDPHGAVVIPEGQRLGVSVRYLKGDPPPPPERRRRRGQGDDDNDGQGNDGNAANVQADAETAGDGKNEQANQQEERPARDMGTQDATPKAPTEWTSFPADSIEYYPTPIENELIYATPVVTDLPLRVIQRFRVENGVIEWKIDLLTTGESPVDIGDLAVLIPWQGPTGNNPAAIFERGYTKHQLINGHGSFVYFTRASGTPPYLLVTPAAGTSLEYFGNVAQPGGGRRGRGRGNDVAASRRKTKRRRTRVVIARTPRTAAAAIDGDAAGVPATTKAGPGAAAVRRGCSSIRRKRRRPFRERGGSRTRRSSSRRPACPATACPMHSVFNSPTRTTDCAKRSTAKGCSTFAWRRA